MALRSDDLDEGRFIICVKALGREVIDMALSGSWRPCLRSTHDRQIVVVLGRVLVTVEVKFGLDQRPMYALFGESR